jgi:hypothetical protein
MTKRLPEAVRRQRIAAGALRLLLRVAGRAVHRCGKHDRRFPTPANGASESIKSNPFDLKNPFSQSIEAVLRRRIADEMVGRPCRCSGAAWGCEKSQSGSMPRPTTCLLVRIPFAALAGHPEAQCADRGKSISATTASQSKRTLNRNCNSISLEGHQKLKFKRIRRAASNNISANFLI